MERIYLTSATYADLEIRILERQEGGYPVEITFSGEQEFPRGYLKLDVLPWVPTTSPEEDGERLFELLFADTSLKEAWAAAKGQNVWRRIRLRLDRAVPELHALPWELLRDASLEGAPRMLAADVSTPVSRYLAGPWRPGRPILSRPIKILVAIANPANLHARNLSPIEVEKEQEILRGAVADIGAEGEQLELTFVEAPVTLAGLEAQLKQGYHILHIIAHGIFQQDDNHAFLFLADQDNHVVHASDTEFADMLGRQGEALRLVFLASCHTATRSSADAFRGFAPTLIAAGVPAVLAMQDAVPMVSARAFAGTFYRQLARHGQVDLASNEARSSLLSAKLPGTAVPVLFTRLRSGMLFGSRGQILGNQGDSSWITLLENIKEGECTPFLGPGLLHGLLPEPTEVAQTLAGKYKYPFPDSDSFPHVAQFLNTLDKALLRREVRRILAEGFKRRMGLGQQLHPQERDLTLSQIIAAAHWSELSQQLMESEVHHQLADLHLPLYITTNFDNFMALALQARGRKPRREALIWRKPPEHQPASPYHDLEPPASVEEPVILHLYGTDEHLHSTDKSPSSVVLTEDDYLDYLACIARDHEYLLPTSVAAALSRTTLLFLGYRWEDLDLKVIMRGLLPHLDLESWGKRHVAVQIEATHTNEAIHREVVHYFERYYSPARIDVYWGSAHQFMAELHSRW